MDKAAGRRSGRDGGPGNRGQHDDGRERPVFAAVILAAGLLLSVPAADLCADEPAGPAAGADCPAHVTDVDGNLYSTVRIGDQVWMAENLRVTRYRDGTPIPMVPDSEEWSDLAHGAYCHQEQIRPEDREVCGLLYNFHAVGDARGLSPPGWHVPTADEWRALIAYLGGTEVAGVRMKDADSKLWKAPVPDGVAESGFAAVPAGGRGRYGGPADLGYYATWWSSSPHDASYAWHWGVYPDKDGVRFNPGHKASGFSVRCVKDRGPEGETGGGAEAGLPDSVSTWKIAFYSQRSGSDHIYEIKSDGTGLRCLTEGTAGGLGPCFSPDGRTILFLRDRSGGGIHAMDGDGNYIGQLIDGPGTERHAAWSPDGSRIAFQSNRDGDYDLYITDESGSAWTRLTDSEGEDMRPSWSPDGKRIVFNSNRDGNWEVYIIGSDGAGLTRVTDSPASELFPAWSPDGGRIAYRSGPPGVFQGDIHTIRPDGTGERKITGAAGVEENPVWSPDGRQIVFQSMRDGDFEIYLIDRDGGPWTNLSGHPVHDYWPTCAPAGTAPRPK